MDMNSLPNSAPLNIKKNTRICFIAPKAYQLFNQNIAATFGGSETQLFLLAREIATYENIKPIFIVADYGQKDVELHNGIEVIKSFDFGRLIPSRITTFLTAFYQSDADIYIQRTITPFSWTIALICKLLKKKFVYMVANDAEADLRSPMYNKFYGKLFARLLFNLTSIIIVQNEYEKQEIAKNFSHKKKMTILKKGIVYDALPCLNEKKKYDFIWIARCTEVKRPEYYIKLAKDLTKYRFLMICPEATGESEYHKKILRLAEEVVNLETLNFVPREKVIDYLSQSKAYCLTSVHEGDWPMTVLESCYCGLPILSLSLNFGELIDQFGGGFFCNDEYAKLVQYASKVIEDEYAYKKMSSGSYNYYKGRHNMKVNARKFLEIIMSPSDVSGSASACGSRGSATGIGMSTK